MNGKTFNKTAIERRVRDLKLDESFEVQTKAEQVAASTAGRIFKRAGTIRHRITTYLNDRGTYTVKAVEA